MEDVRPDSTFMKRLKEIDPRLGCKFNGEIFTITQQTEKYGEVHIWKVVGGGGEFRQPDQRDLDIIRGSNIERVGPDDNFNLATAYMERFRSDNEKKVRDAARHVVLGNKVQISQWFRKHFGSGKGNSAFRRVGV